MVIIEPVDRSPAAIRRPSPRRSGTTPTRPISTCSTSASPTSRCAGRWPASRPGYLSAGNGQEIYCVEERCRGKGDAVCHIIGRTREEWGATAHRVPALTFYECALPRRGAGERDPARVTERRPDAAAGAGPADAEGDERSGLVVRERGDARSSTWRGGWPRSSRPSLVTGESGRRQGAPGPPHPRRVVAQRRPLRGDQLRRGARDLAGERALRPRPRRVHRRRRRTAPGLLRGGQRRHPLPRRDRRDAAGHAGEAPAGAPGAGDPPGRREPVAADRRAGGRGDQPGPRRRMSRPAASARISTTGCRVIELRVPPLRERPEDILPAGARPPGRDGAADRAQGHRVHAAGRRPAAPLRLARQRARAPELRRARRGADRRHEGRRGGPPRRGSDGAARDLGAAAACASSTTSSATTSSRCSNEGKATEGETAEKLGIGAATLYRKLKEYGVTGRALDHAGANVRNFSRPHRQPWSRHPRPQDEALPRADLGRVERRGAQRGPARPGAPGHPHRPAARPSSSSPRR